MKTESYERAKQILNHLLKLNGIKKDVNRDCISLREIRNYVGQADSEMIEQLIVCRVDAKIKTLEAEFESL